MNILNRPSDNAVPTVLSIAGSDPSGGAGIQADLKTFTAIGVYGASVITALTAQNTQAVRAVQPVSADFVKQQLEAVLSDIRVDVIKIGMLPDAAVAKVIAPYLADFTVICDPVMVATSGSILMDTPAIEALIEEIIPLSTYLTPNYNELEVLYGKMVDNIHLAGRDLLSCFDRISGIVLKGGHVNTNHHMVTDIFLLKDSHGIREILEINPRYDTKNSHGTGCTFASAFAAFLAQNYDPEAAFARAVSFTRHLIDIFYRYRNRAGKRPLDASSLRCAVNCGEKFWSCAVTIKIVLDHDLFKNH